MKVYRDSLSENIKTLVGTGILGGGGEANSKMHSLLFLVELWEVRDKRRERSIRVTLFCRKDSDAFRCFSHTLNFGRQPLFIERLLQNQ